MDAVPVEEERVSQEEAGLAGSGEGEFVEEVAIDEENVMEGEAVEAEAAEAEKAAAATTGQEIVTDSFGDLILPQEQAEQLQQAWALVINMSGNRDALADLIYSAFFGASASLSICS